MIHAGELVARRVGLHKQENGSDPPDKPFEYLLVCPGFVDQNTRNVLPYSPFSGKPSPVDFARFYLDTHRAKSGFQDQVYTQRI